jgi:hypothetical protein
MEDPGVTELLRRLSSERPGAAWSEFLERYSPLVMHVIRRYETAHGPVMDCFVYVCGALCDDRFRRLRSFRPDGTGACPSPRDAGLAPMASAGPVLCGTA